jgi:flagellar motor protein MotB
LSFGKGVLTFLCAAIRSDQPGDVLMMARVRYTWLLVLWGPVIVGCGQGNPFLSPQQQAALQQQQQPAQISQSQELQRRIGELDANNRDLHMQVAQAQQQAKVYQDQNELLRKQLRDTATQLRDSQLAQQNAEEQVNTMQASTRRRGGAMITANNSVHRSLSAASIPGVEVRQDQDVIRIELPADQLFLPGTAQLLPAAPGLVDKVADAISRNYPRQRIGIEGHTDSSPAFAGMTTTYHQLSTQQATAVFDLLTRRNHLPANQLFIAGLGSNHPRASNATPAGQAKNRRIELVIYPSTVD